MDKMVHHQSQYNLPVFFFKLLSLLNTKKAQIVNSSLTKDKDLFILYIHTSGGLVMQVVIATASMLVTYC